MSETKKEKPSDGSTEKAQASKQSSGNLKHGSEPDAMLLAVLWSTLETLIVRNEALLATANYHGRPATVIVLVGTQPTDKGIEPVGTANQPLKVPTGGELPE